MHTTNIATEFPDFSDQSSFDSLIKLWWKESRWLMNAENDNSGAYGIPQMNPTSGHEDVPADYYTNFESQIYWGITYITKRYGTPIDAWQHSVELGWY